MDGMFESHSRFPFLEKELTRVHSWRAGGREDHLREFGHYLMAEEGSSETLLLGRLRDVESRIRNAWCSAVR